MNVGIIGSDSFMNKHIRALNNIKDVSITGRYFAGKKENDSENLDQVLDFGDPYELLDHADALIITDRGSLDSTLVVKALKRSKHIFLYPTTVCSVNEAMEFVKLAHEANAILRIGNMGCYNLKGLLKMIPDIPGIKFIELHFYKSIAKSQPVNPIFEALLITTQIINSLVKSQILSVKAKGLMMLSNKPEIINSRLEYDNGCAVNITCNVVAAKDDFQGTIVLKDRCMKYDFISRKLTSWNIKQARENNGSPLHIDQIEIAKHDIIFEEIEGFIHAAISGHKHHETNDNGFEPLFLTDRILEKVNKSVIQHT